MLHVQVHGHQILINGEFNGDPHPGLNQPGVELRANFKSIPHRCHLFAVAFESELTKDTPL